MKKSRLLGAVCACLFLTTAPTTANAVLLDFKLFGLVTSIDTPLQGTGGFSVGESVEFGFRIDSSEFLDSAGSSLAVDGTGAPLYDRYFQIGDYSSTSSGSAESGLFSDQYIIFPTSGQGFTHEDHTMGASSVNGLHFSQIYLRFNFITSPFSGTSDPDDVIPVSELLALSAADIGSFQQSVISFNDPNYENVKFDINDISVTTVPIPAAVWLFGSGLLGLIGIARRKKAA